MKRSQFWRTILILCLCGFFVSLLTSQSITRNRIETARRLELQSFNRELTILNSSITQLSAFLSEPGDLADDDHIVRRLNRFVYGNPGIIAIRLQAGAKTYLNTESSSGEFINGGIEIPICRDLSVSGNITKESLGACDNGELYIRRYFDDFSGNKISLELFLVKSPLPGGAHITGNAGVVSSIIACNENYVEKSPCQIDVPGEFSTEFFAEFWKTFITSLIVSGLFILFLLRLVILPFRTINDMLLNVKSDPKSGDKKSNLNVLSLFREPVRVITEILQEKSALETKHAAAEARARISNEVSHNIRSPLAVLKTVERELTSSSEDTKIAFRSAVTRITDILNMLDPRKDAKHSLSEKREGFLLSSLIEVILSEIKSQYGNRQNLTFDFESSENAYGLFAEVHPSGFKTILSNLVNNAVEAMSGSGSPGKVTLSLRKSEDHECEITVKDNGCGMNEEILSKISNGKFSYGKSNGQGLGLYHARTLVELWGGKVAVKSKVGFGTEIILSLPMTAPPKWFVPELIIQKGSVIGVLDDDLSIHALWKKRLGSFTTLVHFHTAAEFKKAAHADLKISKYLVDYELTGEKENGVDLIEALEISNSSILVTSRFEDQSVLKRCENLNLKLLPKMVAAYVPILSDNKQPTGPLQKLDAIFLDDDKGNHMAWKLDSRSNPKNIRYFLSASALFDQIHLFDKSTPMYVDYRLGKGQEDGIIVCEKLRALGFTDLQLATGWDFDEGELPDWLPNKGKDYPF